MAQMAENRQLTYYEDDQDPDQLYTRRLREGNPDAYFLISSDIRRPRESLRKDAWKPRKQVTKKPSVKITSVAVPLANAVDMIDTADRPAETATEGLYARTGASAEPPENKPMKRLPKAVAFAEAGVGRAKAAYSVFEAEAKGPNASAVAAAGVTGVRAMAGAEIASVSGKAGPVDVKLGLGFDTGVSVGLDGVELKFLGTGFRYGPKPGVSFLGSEVSCSIL